LAVRIERSMDSAAAWEGIDVTKKLPDLLEDMLLVSASPHMDSTEANDVINLMEVFGAPPAGSIMLKACESESAPCDSSIHLVAQSREATLVAS